ncbi:MAG: SGNH/GDSL hydrolase family protein, partial [Gemmatimonadota bacterium]
MRSVPVLALVAAMVFAATAAEAQQSPSILFIGNSFTYGYGSAARFYRPETVTDLNDEGIGGVPALFKSFADQTGLDYDVYLETRGGSGFEFHLDNKMAELTSHPWDIVVFHGQSTLDLDNPGDPTKFMTTGEQLVRLLHSNNPNVEIYPTATWSRADETYPEDGAWHGEPIGAMAEDVRAAYDMLATTTQGITRINPVGEA